MRFSLSKAPYVLFASMLFFLPWRTAAPQTAPPAAAPSSPAASQNQQPTMEDEFPDGPGKAQLFQSCNTVCHTPENVIGRAQDADGWNETLNKMIGIGAQGSDDDFGAILTYLTTNFGPMPAKININKVTAMNLRNWLGLSEKQASLIVAYRTKNGDFKSLDEVEKVPGVNATILDSQKDRLTF